MELKILSVNENLFEGEVKNLTLPGVKGEFQILKDHAPLFALLDKGKIILDNKKEIQIISGIVNVVDNKVNILAKQL